MNYTQLYLIVLNYTHFDPTQLYTIVQIYVIIYTIMCYLLYKLLYNIFTNLECELSPVIELNDTIPSSDNGTSSTNTSELFNWCEHILEEGYRNLQNSTISLESLLMTVRMCIIQTCKFSTYYFYLPYIFPTCTDSTYKKCNKYFYCI